MVTARTRRTSRSARLRPAALHRAIPTCAITIENRDTGVSETADDDFSE
jgi:hypothetical protein